MATFDFYKMVDREKRKLLERIIRARIRACFIQYLCMKFNVPKADNKVHSER